MRIALVGTSIRPFEQTELQCRILFRHWALSERSAVLQFTFAARTHCRGLQGTFAVEVEGKGVHLQLLSAFHGL